MCEHVYVLGTDGLLHTKKCTAGSKACGTQASIQDPRIAASMEEFTKGTRILIPSFDRHYFAVRVLFVQL